MKKILIKYFNIITLVFLIFVISGCEFRYMGDHPELWTMTCTNIAVASGYYNTSPRTTLIFAPTSVLSTMTEEPSSRARASGYTEEWARVLSGLSLTTLSTLTSLTATSLSFPLTCLSMSAA